MKRRLVACVVCLVALAVAVVPAAASGTAPFSQDLRSISYGQSATGAVGPEDPTRDNPRPSANDLSGTWYYEPVTFDGTASDVVRIDLGSAGADTVVVLVAPDGTRVAVNEDGGNGNDSLLVHRLRQSGEYTILVTSHYPETSFDYSLSLTDLDVLYEPDPTTLPSEGQIVGRIDDSDPRLDRFNGHYENVTFRGARDRTATLRLLAPIDSELRLFGPDGEPVAADIEDSSGRNARLTTELPDDGEYTVVAGSNGGSEDYDFMLSVDGARRAPAANGDGEYSGTFAEFDVRSLSMNRSTAYRDEPVRVDARIENYGNKGAIYTGILTFDQKRVATEEVYISGGEARNVTFVVAANETESFEVFLNAEHVGQLDVEPRPPAAVETVSDGNRVRGIVTHGRANGSVTMGLPASNGTADFESLTVSFAEPTERFDVIAVETDRLPVSNGTDAVNVANPTGDPSGTAVGDAANATAAADATNATLPPLPTGIRSAGHLRMTTPNASAVDALANATLSFSLDSATVPGRPATVAVYQFDADEGAAWSPIEPTPVNETDGRYQYRAPVDTSSRYAVGIRRPAFELAEMTLAETALAGRNVTASAVVRNEGALAGTFRLPLKIGNRTVRTANVSLGPGNSTAVSFNRSFETTGTYRVSLGDRTRELVVRSTPTPTADDTSAAQPTTPTAAGSARDPTGGTTTAATGPGFGALTAIVAALSAGLLAVVARARA